MADENNISPLLDGFTLGASIHEHHGVVCFPAIKENSNKKYIVKKISVPANQSQFDAMLLAGAYKDPGDAMEYFRDNGEAILKEAELLQTLSRLEGFLPYDGWQMEPITRRRLGYEVYLVGSYKRSLDKYIRKNAFTHLEAINLGLDLCSALAVCRQAGFLYVDLKPSNIYVSEKKEYRIGDLGFLSLDSLRYASLPERYFSPYTPPELMDPMEPMNLTVDTYAVGMILYQLYNDGNLPFIGLVPTEEIPSPCHADYELAEIIMKAIHPEPDQRWTDPRDLGKAIASYMQRNSVNDIPITPFIPLDVNPEDIVVVTASETHDSDSEGAAEEAVTEETSAAEPEPQESEEGSESEESVPILQEITPAEASAFDEESPIPETAETVVSAEPEEPLAVEISESLQPTEEISDDPQEEELLSATGVSEEVAKIISKADDIISHEIPEEISFPSEEELPDPFAFARDDSEDLDDVFPVDPLMEDPVDSKPEKKKKTKSFENTSRKKKFKKFLSGCFTLILLCGIAAVGFWYYQNIFLQTIDSISISGTQDEITVLVDTSIEESRLAVHCTDGSGKSKTASVHGGKAVISGLKPSTEYTISLNMTGFHKLVGHASDVFITDSTTQVLTFQGIAGSEHGSVILEFTVDGKDPDFWNIRYFAEGEDERMETVTGHSAMITGLTVGKVYTFTLDGGKNFDLGGETELQFLASRLILAEDLRVTSEDGSEVILHWNIPGDVVVDNWNVRYYDGYGFEEQITVAENQVRLSNIDPASDYTVEITAAGMTEPSRIRITADPILVSEFKIEKNSETEIKVTWDASGDQPEGGWLLMYSIDGSGRQEVTCEKASCVISPLIPGARYDFTLQASDGRTVFNNTEHYQAEEANPFTANAFVRENVSMDLLKTPEEEKWTCDSIEEESFTNMFAAGESASIAMRSSSALYHPGSKTKILYAFRDAYGNALPEFTSEESCIWKNIWNSGDPKNGELTIPKLPNSPGNYIMELYFDGCFAAEFEIIITE